MGIRHPVAPNLERPGSEATRSLSNSSWLSRFVADRSGPAICRGVCGGVPKENRNSLPNRSSQSDAGSDINPPPATGRVPLSLMRPPVSSPGGASHCGWESAAGERSSCRRWNSAKNLRAPFCRGAAPEAGSRRRLPHTRVAGDIGTPPRRQAALQEVRCLPLDHCISMSHPPASQSRRPETHVTHHPGIHDTSGNRPAPIETTRRRDTRLRRADYLSTI